MNARLTLLLLAVLMVAGCAGQPTPAGAPVRVVQVTATPGPAVVVQVTATPAVAAAAKPASTATLSTAPAAKLVRNEPAGKCRWVIYMYLTGFAPNSIITVDSNFDETQCPSGKRVTGGHWTEPYGKATDANGRLMIDYLHEATGSYLYVFTDEQGNQASLPFETKPEGGPPTATLAARRAATATHAPEPLAVVKSPGLNLRSGPGTHYPVVGKATQGDRLYPVARWGNCEWLQVGVLGQSEPVWVAGGSQFVTLNVPCASLRVETNLPPTPLPPPTAIYRPPTGLLSRSGGFGRGVLRVKNGTDSDGVVILVTLAGSPAQAAYIRKGDAYELDQIADGRYRLYFTKGAEWDRASQQFTSGVSRQRFADVFDFSGGNGWEVTLYGVAGGNAGTQNVAPGDFPGLP